MSVFAGVSNLSLRIATRGGECIAATDDGWKEEKKQDIGTGRGAVRKKLGGMEASIKVVEEKAGNKQTC